MEYIYKSYRYIISGSTTKNVYLFFRLSSGAFMHTIINHPKKNHFLYTHIILSKLYNYN